MGKLRLLRHETFEGLRDDKETANHHSRVLNQPKPKSYSKVLPVGLATLPSIRTTGTDGFELRFGTEDFSAGRN